jgi:hypothetical protein
MPIDKTIPGGAYQNADGSLVDANGKPVKNTAALQDLQAKQEQERQELEQSLTVNQVTPGAPLVAQIPGSTPTRTSTLPAPGPYSEYSRPEDMVKEDEPEEVKRKVSKKKG